MGEETNLVQSLIDLVLRVSEAAGEMDGRLGFFLGLVTWFLVDQAISKMANLLKWAVLVGALSAAGYTIVQFLPYF